MKDEQLKLIRDMAEKMRYRWRHLATNYGINVFGFFLPLRIT